MQKLKLLYLTTRMNDILKWREGANFDKKHLNAFLRKATTQARKIQQEKELSQFKDYQNFHLVKISFCIKGI